MRRALVRYAGFAVLAVAVVHAWSSASSAPVEARALPRPAPLLPVRAPEVREPALPASLPGPVNPLPLPGAVLADLHGDFALQRDTAALSALTPEQQLKKLDKLLNKLQNKHDKLELKVAQLNEKLELLQAAIDAALLLPDGPAKDKLLAKLQKKLEKLQGNINAKSEKIEDLEFASEFVIFLIEEIDPEFFEVDGLSAPEQLEVVTADEQVIEAASSGGTVSVGEGGASGGAAGGGFHGGALGLLGPGDFPAGSDFVTDASESYVYDQSMEVLETVNSILCMIAQTAYDQMVNEGTYLAQIDESLCDQGSDSSANGSEAGQSAGGGGEALSLWVVNSEREDDQSDEIVKAWVPNDDDDMGPATIRAKFIVSEGVSEADPFGAFGLNFAGIPFGGTLADAAMHGFLHTLDVQDGSLGFSFYETKGDLDAEPFPQDSSAEIVKASVRMSGDQSAGSARILHQRRENFGGEGDTGIVTSEYLIAFDETSVLRAKNGEPGECLSRTDFFRNTWRYNLYEAQGEDVGQQVQRNAGFGIKTLSGQYGWIGYWGLWLPAGVNVQTGDVVTKSTFDDGPLDAYTLVIAPGKLIRNTRQTLDLAQADGELFTWWDFTPPAPPPGGPPQQQPTQYQVQYDGGTQQFLEIGTLDPSGLTPMEPVAIDTASLGVLSMWSESLGGSVSYVDGDTFITYWAQAFVNGSDELFAGGDDVAFYGYVDCLDHGLTAAQAEQGQVFLPNAFDLGTPHRFLFRKSDLSLYDDADGTGSNLALVGLLDGEVPQSGPFTWGMRSGPMLLDTAGLASTFDAWNQPVFYTWETGANSWNHYATVQDGSGDDVTFDAPLQFSYTHAVENDSNGDDTFAGKTFLLSYNGAGELHGIPMLPSDLDGDGNPDRWYPQFSLADGVLMGPTGTEYVVRGVQHELTLQPLPGGCEGKTTDAAAELSLPAANEYVAPDIGPKPVVEDPPAVIAGEVQDTEG